MTIQTSTFFSTFFSTTMTLAILFHAMAFLAFATCSRISFRKRFHRNFVITAICTRAFSSTSNSSFKTLTIVLLAFSFATGTFCSFTYNAIYLTEIFQLFFKRYLMTFFYEREWRWIIIIFD